jgi:formylglycine-generating enzyme required for sulfatase activity
MSGAAATGAHKSRLAAEQDGVSTETAAVVRVGLFVMGSGRDYPEQAPAHNVAVDDFWSEVLEAASLVELTIPLYGSATKEKQVLG